MMETSSVDEKDDKRKIDDAEEILVDFTELPSPVDEAVSWSVGDKSSRMTSEDVDSDTPYTSPEGLGPEVVSLDCLTVP